MARGDKDYDKKVRKVNKGQKSCKKIDTVHKMVESLIKNDSDEAAEHLHTYLQMTARELLLGESDDDDKDDKDSDDKDDKPKKGKKGVNPFAKKDDKDSDDDDDDKDDDKDSDDDDKDDKKKDKKDDKKEEKDED